MVEGEKREGQQQVEAETREIPPAQENQETQETQETMEELITKHGPESIHRGKVVAVSYTHLDVYKRQVICFIY